MKGEKMKLSDLFTHRTENDLHTYLHIKKPSAIGSIEDVMYYSGRAQQAIHEAEERIALMKEYQQALYERYQEIYGTNYKLFLLLKREVHYSGTKSYVITISKKFDGNNVADEITLRETFEGKERHKALKRFEELKKEYPNIENEKDIAKRQWER